MLVNTQSFELQHSIQIYHKFTGPSLIAIATMKLHINEVLAGFQNLAGDVAYCESLSHPSAPF